MFTGATGWCDLAPIAQDNTLRAQNLKFRVAQWKCCMLQSASVLHNPNQLQHYCRKLWDIHQFSGNLPFFFFLIYIWLWFSISHLAVLIGKFTLPRILPWNLTLYFKYKSRSNWIPGSNNQITDSFFLCVYVCLYRNEFIDSQRLRKLVGWKIMQLLPVSGTSPLSGITSRLRARSWLIITQYFLLYCFHSERVSHPWVSSKDEVSKKLLFLPFRM